jgi:putative restriction endonuclease
MLLARMRGVPVERSAMADVSDLSLEGREREAQVRVHVNQSFFRAAVLTAYNFRCCISGIAVPELLDASHIVPWTADAANRVNPRNGLCLNALLDRAFDRGLITVTPEYHVRVSGSLMRDDNRDPLQETILRYHGQRIHAPERFAPEQDFLRYHNDRIFRD